MLVVGAGGLGLPAALALAAAGVGTIAIADDDRVEVSNLHRQPLHRPPDVGREKAESAARALRRFWPSVRIVPIAERLREDNAEHLIASFDFTIDATDTAASKFLINDAAVAVGAPFSHAGAMGFGGQTMTVLPGKSPCLRCLFPEPPAPGEVPGCHEAGVLGGVVGVIGALQAAEALRILSGTPARLAGRMLTYDGLAGSAREVELARNPRCPVCAMLGGGEGAEASRRSEAHGLS